MSVSAAMLPPPGTPERLIALLAGGADRVVLEALSRFFFVGQRKPIGPLEFARVVERVARYTAPELLAHPDRLMPAPERAPRMTIREQKPLHSSGYAPQRWTPSEPLRSLRRARAHVGFDEHAHFATPYRPIDPEYAGEYAGYPELDTVHLWSWRHREPARASVLLTHGWGVGPWWMHRLEYDVPYLFHALGLDVYFYLAPFHGRRTPASARFGGELHPSPNLIRTNEAFVQTVIELRAAISVILARNSAPLGMMGSSLGGYTCALLASLDDRLDFVIPVMPPASMAHLMWDHGEHAQLRKRAEDLGLTRERLHEFWALHSPLSHTPKLPRERRMIVTALGDTLVTAEHTRPLWEHWDRPRLFRFPGGHAWQLRAKLYHREIGRFLREIDVLEG